MHTNLSSGTSYSLSSVLQSAYSTRGYEFLYWGDIIPFVPSLGDVFKDPQYLTNNSAGYKAVPDRAKKNNIDILAPMYPISDMYIEQDGTMRIEIAVTGFDDNDIKITAVGSDLTITGKPVSKRDEAPRIPDKKVYGKIKIEPFTLTYECGDTYNTAAATATFKKGILIVRIPLKKEFKKDVVDIEISR